MEKVCELRKRVIWKIMQLCEFCNSKYYCLLEKEMQKGIVIKTSENSLKDYLSRCYKYF